MANILPTSTFGDWVKNPLTGALILIGSLLTVFVYAFNHTSNNRVQDCKEEVQYLRASRDSVTILYMNLLNTNKIKSDELARTYDSIAREKTEEKIKKLLEK